MANFPDNPTDGQKIVEEATDGSSRVAIWTYDSLNQQWTYELYEVYTGEKAIYTDQVIVRQPDPENYPELQTQMDVNQLVGSELGLTGEYVVYTDQIKERGTDLTQAQINVTSAASHSAVAQNIDQIQGTKSKGTWQFHGGPIPDDNVPAVNQFWLSDEEDQRTQEFCKAAFVRIHALGNQTNSYTKDRVVLGVGEVGDKLIIQDLADRDGGKYTITSVELHEPDGEDYTKAYAVYGVEPDPMYCVGSVSPAEIVTIRLASGEEADYLPLSGGTVTGPTTFDCPTMVKWDKASSNSYPFSVYGGDKWAFRVGWDGAVKSFGEFTIDQPSGTAFRIKKDHVDKVKIEHGGRIFCAYDLGLDSDDRTVTTKGWVKEQIEAAPSGGSFNKSYDGNRFCVSGNMSTDLNNGDVLFMDAEYKQTDNPDSIAYISLPKDEFDWTTFTGNGNIKVKAGSSTAGYYYAYAFMHQASAQVLVSVFPLKTYPDKKLEADSGAPCYFQGVFFG